MTIELHAGDFSAGSLQAVSYARPGKLFSANSTLIVAEIGTLTTAALASVIDSVVDLIRPPNP